MLWCTTSAVASSSWRIAMPSGRFRSIVMLRLPRLQHMAMWLCIQNSSNTRLLTLITSAPRSDSSCVPNGPATAARAEDVPGPRHPAVGPPAVAGAEEALRRPRIGHPRQDARVVGVLHPLPRPDRGGQHALQQRRVHVLAATGDLPGSERR